MDKLTKAIEEAKSRGKIFTEDGWTEHEVEIFVKGFVEGSEWSIESAYHQPGDIPEENEMILCETKDGPMIAGPFHKDFNDTVEHFGITRWAYTNDLMPWVAPSPEKKDVNPKFRTGDLVVLKSYQKCIELNKDWQLNEAALKGLMGRKFKIEDIEIENGQVFYKLDEGINLITHFPECFLDYVGNSLQVPKMNAVTSKYIKGQFVVIRSEIELRSMFGKDADLTDYIPYAGEVVMIDEIVKVGSGFLYKIRKYHHKEAIYVSEDVILCNANGRLQREPLECRNEIDSITVRDIHVAQLDTSKLNPSPMQIWNEMLSGTKGFLSSASPELRAFAAGQLLGLSEMIMKEMTDGKVKIMEWYNNPTCKPILDVCCGSRMFWFDKENPLATFTDIRDFDDTLCDGRHLSVHPDRIEDCTSLSFADKSFKLVVFDPPHLVKAGENSWLAKKYGKLSKDWKAFINDSIHECMRVLDDYGVLIFKWNQDQIKVKDVINAITDYKPLFGHPTRRNETTIWMCFMKIPNANE